MIKRIIKINNVGRYRNTSCSGIEFKKITYISALNTYGKSTLCDIFKSSNADYQTSLMERKSIPVLDTQPEQIVHYKFLNDNNNEKSVKYNIDKWEYDLEIKDKTKNIFVFDNKFVEDNIFYGGKIEFENSSNLTNFLISDEAIILQKELIELKEIQKKNTAEFGSIKKLLKTPPQFTLEKLIKLNPLISLDECKEQFEQEESRIKDLKLALRDLKEIKTKNIISFEIKTFEELYSSYFNNLNECLQKSFKEITADILRHLEQNTNNPNYGLQWIIDGSKIQNNNICPYCGQETTNCKLVTEYTRIVAQDIKDYIEKINILLNQFHFKDFIIKYIEMFEKNIQNAEFIEKYINNIYFTSLISEIKKDFLRFKESTHLEYISFVESLSRDITSVIAMKKNAPLSCIQIVNYNSFRIIYNKCKDKLFSIYLKIDSLKKLSDDYISSLNETSIQQEISIKEKRLNELSIIESYLQQQELINNYINCDFNAKEIARKIKEKSIELEDTSSEFLKQYHKKVNDLFKQFGSGDFVLDIKISNQGSKQTWKLSPKYKGSEVNLSDIRNLFSESDKRSLALAVFLARLQDSKLQDKIIILDDPSTSFDDNRIFSVNNYLLNLSRKVKQLIITSHYGQADASFRRIFSSEDVSYLSICQTDQNTSTITTNYFKIQNFDTEFKNLYQIAYENKHEDIDILKPKIRIFTENYLKNRYRIYLINHEELNTLGAIINHLKTISGAITEEQKDLYESINRDYSPAHHSYPNHNFEETKLVLMSIFEDMKR